MQPASGEAGDRQGAGVAVISKPFRKERIGFYQFKGTVHFLKEGILSSISSSDGTPILTLFSSNGTLYALVFLPMAPPCNSHGITGNPKVFTLKYSCCNQRWKPI